MLVTAMPRKKLSEYRAKTMVAQALGQAYAGWSINTSTALLAQLAVIPAGTYVVKVDQAVKGRFKKGLVILDVAKNKLAAAVRQLKAKGYQWVIIEPMLQHEAGAERYISLARTRDGLELSFNPRGGIDVETHADTMQTVRVTPDMDLAPIAQGTGLAERQLQALLDVFEAQYVSFMEINPYVVTADGVALLDLAIEVDDAGAFFADAWRSGDFRQPHTAITAQEAAVLQLAEKSPASFKLDIINPHGAIFLLLSGGGASIVVADEVRNLGYGDKLANYGEYSGNPTADETFLYTSAVLSLLAASRAPKKVLFIGGAVANFTDIANTFGGVIRALDAHAAKLKQQHVKVFVRRGGPRQEIGLKKIESALQNHGLLGAVHSPATPLTAVVAQAVGDIA
jgi:ATP-citrate lyase beta-subunit